LFDERCGFSGRDFVIEHIVSLVRPGWALPAQALRLESGCLLFSGLKAMTRFVRHFSASVAFEPDFAFAACNGSGVLL
jgi:hypothetical protein